MIAFRTEQAEEPRDSASSLHFLCCEQAEHLDWLADQVGEPHLEARQGDVYDRVVKCIWSLDDRYRDRWQDGEEEGDGGDSAP
jgi:hypothetical protein